MDLEESDRNGTRGRTAARPRAAAPARVACALLLLVATLAIAEPEDARSPVPEAAARTAAVAELKKELRDELRSKDPELKRGLARKLLDRAKASESDPVKRYVALDQAATLAQEVRDVRLALDVAEQLAAAFQVKRAASGLASIEAITRGAKESAVFAEAANACVELGGDALAADDHATATKAISSAKAYAKAAQLRGLDARATALVELVVLFRKMSLNAESMSAALAATPDDPAANEALGRFLCFGRGRWAEGLAHFAKSGNAALAQLAAQDLQNPEGAATRLGIADAWWDLAQKEKDALARARMVARAASTYEAALSNAPEDRFTAAKQRLESVTYWAWNRGVALTKDFSKDGPASLGLAAVRAYIEKQHIDRNSDNWRTKLPRFPDVSFSRSEEYLWRLDTNQGPITIRFFSDTAPKHVANFLYLTELGFFDGTQFHRVIPGFMAQGGSSTPAGNGGPGYTFGGEFGSDRKHDKPGVLSMANAGPNTDASQFFITFGPAAHLDGKHTVFGEVVDGMDAVKKLEAQGTPEPGTPKIKLMINTARVTAR